MRTRSRVGAARSARQAARGRARSGRRAPIGRCGGRKRARRSRNAANGSRRRSPCASSAGEEACARMRAGSNSPRCVAAQRLRGRCSCWDCGRQVAQERVVRADDPAVQERPQPLVDQRASARAPAPAVGASTIAIMYDSDAPKRSGELAAARGRPASGRCAAPGSCRRNRAAAARTPPAAVSRPSVDQHGHAVARGERDQALEQEGLHVQLLAPSRPCAAARPRST